jgi:hypothetical protein
MKIGDAGAIAVGKTLEKENDANFSELNLSKNYNKYPIGSNKVEDEGAIAIGCALENNKNLTILDLGNKCNKFYR